MRRLLHHSYSTNGVRPFWITGRWIFHNNSTNPDYVRRVIAAGNIIAIE